MAERLSEEPVRIGAMRVTRIGESEGWGALARDLFPDFDRAALKDHESWLSPHFWDAASGRVYTSFHSWLLDTGRTLILIDPCAGNGKHRPDNARFHRLDTPYLERLASAGAAPEDVGLVICTHLHADHCGWNTRLSEGAWVPTFPNARYICSRIECHASDPQRTAIAANDPNAGCFEDSVRPIIEAGLLDLIDRDTTIRPGVHLEHAAGHTPGHLIVRARSNGAEAIFSGDVLHQPMQIVRPDWNSRYCEDPARARATRRRLLQSLADRDAILFPSHFGSPYYGRVAATDGGGFTFMS